MRLFFALWPPAQTAAALADWAAQAQRATGGRATQAGTIHLTLAFLGEVAQDRIDSALEAARRVRAEPHALPIEQAKRWAHNRILWVGPRETPRALAMLARSLHSELQGQGFAIERRPFAAHVTLIRNTRRDALLPPLPAPEWPVTEFSLVRSRLSARGPSYESVERFALVT